MANEKRLIFLDDLMKFPIRIDHYDKVNGNEHFVFGVETVLEYAEHLPTVDAVEVVHGRWIEINPRKDVEGWIEFDYQCPVCKEVSWEESNYCPNCGAKMDGDGNA